jgi:hypothetical protein
MFVSFICKLLLLVLCIWHFYSVYKVFPFPMSLYDAHYICYGSVFVSLVFNIWFEYAELLLLFLIACMCPFYVVWHSLHVFLMHFNGQSFHYIDSTFDVLVSLWELFRQVLYCVTHFEDSFYLCLIVLLLFILLSVCLSFFLFHCMWKWPIFRSCVWVVACTLLVWG